MKVLVTGASGMVGSTLTQQMTADGHEVVPVVRRDARSGEVQWKPSAGELGSRSSGRV